MAGQGNEPGGGPRAVGLILEQLHGAEVVLTGEEVLGEGFLPVVVEVGVAGDLD